MVQFFLLHYLYFVTVELNAEKQASKQISKPGSANTQDCEIWLCRPNATEFRCHLNSEHYSSFSS